MLWQFHGGVNLKNELLVLVWTVSNGCSLTALSSVKFAQCSGSFTLGVNLKNELLVLVCPYIFLLFDCFEWALIDCIVKCKVCSVLWQFHWGGGKS